MANSSGSLSTSSLSSVDFGPVERENIKSEVCDGVQISSHGDQEEEKTQDRIRTHFEGITQ